jgi:hypothetical protein
VARVSNKIGQVQTNAGDLPAALQTYRQTLVQMSDLAAAAPQSVPYRRGVGIAAMKIGDIAHLMHDHQAAFASHRQAEQIRAPSNPRRRLPRPRCWRVWHWTT